MGMGTGTGAGTWGYTHAIPEEQSIGINKLHVRYWQIHQFTPTSHHWQARRSHTRYVGQYR